MKTLKTLKHIALLVGMLLMSLVGVGQVISEYPYIADFDLEWPSGWTYRGFGWYGEDNYGYAGSISSSTSPNNVLWTPDFVIPNIGECIFYWYDYNFGKNTYCLYLFKYTNYINNEVERWSIGPIKRTSNRWSYCSFNLQDFLGDTIYFAFYHSEGTSNSYLLIDDVSIEWDNPLPIHLLEFSVEPRYDHQTGVHVLNLLTIRTGYEYNNCEFIVYRSEDAINWDYDIPVCKWDFGKDSAIYNEALDTVLNYFTIEHPNGQTYYPVDTIPYPVTYYKLIQRDCDNTSTEYTSKIIVCIANQQKNLIEPYVICDNGPQAIAGSEVCKVFVQNVLGQVVEEFQLQPYQQREVLAKIQGMYLITFVYKYNGEARKKTEKIICM